MKRRSRKDLGVWIDKTVKPSNHEAEIVKMAHQLFGLVRRTFTYMDCSLMRQLFTSVVRLYLEYVNVVLRSYLKRDIELIEKVQHSATQI